jgi:hypothetical protein
MMVCVNVLMYLHGSIFDGFKLAFQYQQNVDFCSLFGNWECLNVCFVCDFSQFQDNQIQTNVKVLVESLTDVTILSFLCQPFFVNLSHAASYP